MQKHRFWTICAAISIWILSIVGYLHFRKSSLFLAQENYLENLRWQLRPERRSSLKLIYLNADAETAAQIGPPPWNRGLWADLISILNRYGKVKVIGIDFIFSNAGHSTSRQGNELLRKETSRDSNIVFAATYSTRQERNIGFPFIFDGYSDPHTNPLPETPELAAIGSNGIVGYIDYVAEARPRMIPMFAQTPAGVLYPFSLRLFLKYNNYSVDDVRIENNQINIVGNDGKVLRAIPIARGQLHEINWSSKWHSNYNVMISIVDVVRAREMFESGTQKQKREAEQFFSQFRDSVVLIGPTDELMQDLSLTPLDEYAVPKVSVHGNALKALQDGAEVFRPPTILGVILSLVFGAVCIPLLFEMRRHWVFWVVLAFLPVFYIGLSYLLILQERAWLLPLAQPLDFFATALLLFTGFGIYLSEQQKQYTQQLFGSYVSPIVVKRLVALGELPSLGGSEENISAFFSDIEGFSSFSETLSPERLTQLMNSYLGWMTENVYAHQGTLDKYIGDAVVAMFGAPLPLSNHALAACQTGLAILRSTENFNKNLPGEWPDSVRALKTRIGINSGPAVVGNMGSALRFNYTMMGDSVNLAARCESLCKFYGLYFMVTDSTVAALPKELPFFLRPVDKVQVVGRKTGVILYQPLDSKPVWLDQYLDGWAAYEAGDWKKAKEVFDGVQIQDGHRSPSTILSDRCRQFSEHPPEGWTGYYKHLTKG